MAVVSLDASMISEKKDTGISAKGSTALTTKIERVLGSLSYGKNATEARLFTFICTTLAPKLYWSLFCRFFVP